VEVTAFGILQRPLPGCASPFSSSSQGGKDSGGAHSGHFLNVLDEERCSSRRCLGLRAAFGFVEVLRILEHDDGHDQGDGEPLDEGEEPPPVDR
jgi:hypothetical protein